VLQVEGREQLPLLLTKRSHFLQIFVRKKYSLIFGAKKSIYECTCMTQSIEGR
jgi:hypothetical protein